MFLSAEASGYLLHSNFDETRLPGIHAAKLGPYSKPPGPPQSKPVLGKKAIDFLSFLFIITLLLLTHTTPGWVELTAP